MKTLFIPFALISRYTEIPVKELKNILVPNDVLVFQGKKYEVLKVIGNSLKVKTISKGGFYGKG